MVPAVVAMFQGTLGPVSNTASWRQPFELLDEDTGESVSLTDCDIAFQIFDPKCKSTVLSATLDNEKITLLDDAAFEVFFTLDEMSTLNARTHTVGCTITKGDDVIQIILGDLPVLDGIMT